MSKQLLVNETDKNWKVFEFFVPIKEKISDGDNFIIRGVAINETTTLNNVKYVDWDGDVNYQIIDY